MITSVRLQAEVEARWKDTLQALQSVREGRTVEEEEVLEWLESWGSADERKPPRA